MLMLHLFRVFFNKQRTYPLSRVCVDAAAYRQFSIFRFNSLTFLLAWHHANKGKTNSFNINGSNGGLHTDPLVM